MKLILRNVLLAVAVIFYGTNAYGQLPTCVGASSGYVYILSGTQIWNWDPHQPLQVGINPVLNTISVPPGCNGLAVANNINSATGPSPTFYTTSGTYWWYDGTTWVNTGHNSSTVNIGGGGPYVFGLIGGGTAQIYRYDGTGPDVFVTSVVGFNNAPYDIVGDDLGNFYVLSPN